MTTTITAQVHGYSITLTGSAISISRDSGEWAGDGRWEDGRIIDCAAHLGATDEESESIYGELEDALQDAIDESERTDWPSRIAAADTLDALVEIISEIAEERRSVRSDAGPEAAEDVARHVDWCRLPTYGGADLSGTAGVWSWDASRMLVGTCPEDMRLEARTEE